MKLLSFIFIIKLIAQSNIFSYRKEKHGQKKLQEVRNLEMLKLKYIRITNGIKFIKSCKKKRIIPTFARISNDVVTKIKKLEDKICVLVMNAELERKHREKRDLLQQIDTLKKIVYADLSTTLKSVSYTHLTLPTILRV